MAQPVICHLSDFAPEYGGSFVDSQLALARQCREVLQLETVHFFPERAKNRSWLLKFDREKIKYGFVPLKRNVVPTLKQSLKDVEPLIFNSHFFTFDLSALALNLLFFRSAKVVLHVHSLAASDLTQRLKDFVKVRIIGRNFVDRVVPVGDSVLADARKRGYPSDKLSLIYNGINTSRFVVNDVARRTARKALGVSDDSIVFLLLGYNPLIKGVDIFVKAAIEAGARGFAKNRFVIVGRAETQEFVAKMAAPSSLQSVLQVIPPQEDFPTLLNGVDVLVSASRREGFSYAIAEAMASAKPALISDIFGMREIYGRAEGAWLFPPENWKALSVLMEDLARISVIERSKLGEMNRQYIVERHSLQQWSKAMVDLYTNLLSEGDGRVLRR